MTYTTDIDFAYYMDKVDSHLENLAGVGHLDLPDWDYRDAFDSGMTARSAADAALINANFF